MVELAHSLKGYTTDQDKAVAPKETVARVRELLETKHGGILESLERTDTGRLGIPVFISRFGPKALDLVPTRKQMGKGASPEQAEASALMELVERYSFFTFFNTPENFEEMIWTEAEKHFGDRLISLMEMRKSVNEILRDADTRQTLDQMPWRFCKAVRPADGSEHIVPANYFKLLNEFNGSSAGNSLAETVMQGSCEVVERHVCAVIDKTHPTLCTIGTASIKDPVLLDLLDKFERNGIKVWLKDFSLGMPVPTVGALAYDPSTFPEKSEIVLTAGTASSPTKAAIRALTEVAQLAGDFETNACYEPSGMSKPADLESIQWLIDGPTMPLSSLPDVSNSDILEEITSLAIGLQKMGYDLYAIDTTNPELGVPACYCFVPGFQFLERAKSPSLGLYVGRRLAEEYELERAVPGLKILSEIYEDAPFLSFFQGLVNLKAEDPLLAQLKFDKAADLQEVPEDRALAYFYSAYALTQSEAFNEALPRLDKAIELESGVKEYYNLRGVCRFRRNEYELAAKDFEAAIKLDKGSVMDLANLGLCHKRLGNTAEAVRYLEAAIAIDGDLDFAIAELAEIIG
ncbi:MAG: YcaO-like family protein [Desulfovibrio sp.]|uniref:YcaO-like family protein n=1 Tax=Desulfovibrio sp. 7SRBS1 TaxID=3378064 RepID=UPI003B3EA08D